MGESARWSGTGPSAGPAVQCAFDRDLDEWTAWLDLQPLAAICDPDSDRLGPRFGQDAAADVLPPGPVLAALTKATVTHV